MSKTAKPKPTPCSICGELPIIEKIQEHWWNATHEECLGEPGVSCINSRSSDRAITAWNKWNEKVRRREVAIIRIDRLIAEQNRPIQPFLFQTDSK